MMHAGVRVAAALLAALWLAPARAVSVEAGGLRVEFYESAAGRGRVARIVETATGRLFTSKTVFRPPWSIQCRRTDDYAKTRHCQPFDARAEMRYEAAPIPGGWSFVYRDVDECLAEVVCRVTADREKDCVRWRISAVPKPGWATYEIDYPSVPLAESLGASSEDDCVMMGTAKGGVNRWPMKPGREYWKSRLYETSPGRLTSAYGCFYDPEGGLYTAAEDDAGWFKGLLMDRWWRSKRRPDGTYREGDFLLEWRHFEFSAAPRTLAYDVVMRAFRGTDGEPCDWRDAADIYWDWAKDRRWAKTKLAARKDVPAWAKNGPAKVKFNRSWYAHPGLVQRWVKEYWRKRFPGVPFVAQTEGWERHGDWVTPEYFPCYPDDASFSRVCADLKKADGHMWAWPGGHHWNVRVGRRTDGTYNLDYSDLFAREVKPHCAFDPNGEVHLDALKWLGGGESATLCPATAYARNWWNDYVACGLVRRGVGLVQADQDVCARVRACWSRDHGHVPGDGKWMTDALRAQFETMLAAMRGIDPRAQFSFEEPNEFYNDILCFQDYRNCRFFGTEWASAFNYLYHEYITPYQPGSEFWSKWQWVAHAAADGQMPAFPEEPSYYFEMPALWNGSFETVRLGVTGFADWSGARDMQTVITNDATDGRYALGVTARAGTNTQADVWTTLPAWAFAGSARAFRLRAQVKTTGEPGLLRVWDALAPKTLYKTVATPPADGAWHTVTLDFDIDAAAPRRIRCGFLAKGAEAFRVDDVKFLARAADGAWREVTRKQGAEQLAFAERWADLYHRHAKWLQHGRHLHPPRVTCEMLPYHERFRGEEADLVKPAVHCGAFRAADGTEAVLFVNATDRRQPFVWRWKGRTTEDAIEPRGLKLEIQDSTVRLEVTGYCNCGDCCNWRRTWFGFGSPVVAAGPHAGEPKEVGRTARGTQAAKGTLAADPKVFPYGTRFTIPGYGEGEVLDTGSALKGNRVDAWFPTHEEARAWGRRTVTAVRPGRTISKH